MSMFSATTTTVPITSTSATSAAVTQSPTHATTSTGRMYYLINFVLLLWFISLQNSHKVVCSELCLSLLIAANSPKC